MKLRLLIVLIAGLALSTNSIAQEDYTADLNVEEIDLTEVPEEIEEIIVTEADKEGHNLDKPKDRKKWHKKHKQKREKLAKELGFDLKTKSGKDAFKKYMDDQFKKVAKEKGVDMKSPEGRKAVIQEFAKKGQLPLVPLQRAPFEKQGWKFEPRPLDVREMPNELQGLMANQAAELGIDISTEKGQKELANHIYKEKVKEAKKAGFDYTNPAGKEKYEKHVDKELKQLAKKEKMNLKKPKERQKLMEKMAKKGQLAFVPTEPRAMERVGFEPPKMNRSEMGKKMKNKNSKSDMKKRRAFNDKKENSRMGASQKHSHSHNHSHQKKGPERQKAPKGGPGH